MQNKFAVTSTASVMKSFKPYLFFRDTHLKTNSVTFSVNTIKGDLTCSDVPRMAFTSSF
jgi:hypothetical protein